MSLQHCALSTSASTWQSKKHKCYKCKQQYQHDNQKSTSAVNAYINTKAFHIQPPTVWLCTDTHMHTPTQWHTHTLLHTHTHSPSPTHTCIHNTIFSQYWDTNNIVSAFSSVPGRPDWFKHRGKPTWLCTLLHLWAVSLMLPLKLFQF